ncbi:MAG: AraC family transcriptional regulator [Bacteroidales bacterium]|nr:AraC family transcriptional regulator [Bacteroidales bacterium]
MIFLIVIGLILSLSFSIYFFFISKKHVKADEYLGGVFLLVFVMFMYSFFGRLGFFEKFPQFLLLDIGIPFLLGPMIWFYVESLTTLPEEKTSAKFMHILPVILLYVFMGDIFFLPLEGKMAIIKQPSADLNLRFQIFTFLQLSPVPIYMIISILRVKKYQNNLKKVFSSVEKLNHKLLMNLLVTFLIFWLIISFGSVFQNFVNLSRFLSYINVSSFVVFVLLSGFYGIKRNSVIKKIIDVKEEEIVQEKEIDDNPEFEFIDKYIIDKKPHLSPDLTINDLANSLKIPAHKLSKALNSHYNSNFFDYINSKRIEEFKGKIAKNEHVKSSILAIAFDSGFNSKSAFYRYFKKLEGLTPSEYISKL